MAVYSDFEQLVLQPVNTITAGDLTQAAGTSLAKFAIPSAWSPCYIEKFGMTMAAAGGAQTTAGKAELEIAGTDVTDADSATITLASVASHAAWSQVEQDLNARSTDLADSSNKYNAEPSYPTASTGNLIEVKVNTQGVGSDQTAFFYLVIRRKGGQ